MERGLSGRRAPHVTEPHDKPGKSRAVHDPGEPSSAPTPSRRQLFGDLRTAPLPGASRLRPASLGRSYAAANTAIDRLHGAVPRPMTVVPPRQADHSITGSRTTSASSVSHILSPDRMPGHPLHGQRAANPTCNGREASRGRSPTPASGFRGSGCTARAAPAQQPPGCLLVAEEACHSLAHRGRIERPQRADAPMAEPDKQRRPGRSAQPHRRVPSSRRPPSTGSNHC